MKPQDVAAQEFADRLGVSVSYAKRLVARMGTPDAYRLRKAEGAARAEAAMMDEVAAIDDLDLEHVSREADPPAALTSLVSGRAERTLRAQVAAHASWAQTDDRAARTAKARAAMDARFEREVDPEGTLNPADRARRAAHARKAYYLKLALKSAQARRRRKEIASRSGE